MATQQSKKVSGGVRPLIVGFVIVAIGMAAIAIHLSQDPASTHWETAVELLKTDPARARPFLEIIIAEYPKSPYAERARALIGSFDVAKTVESATTDSMLPPPVFISSRDAEELYRQARLFYALGYKSRDDLRAASSMLLMIADSFPTDPVAADALFEAALCLSELDQTEQAVAIWQKFIAKFPRDGRVPEAIYAIGYSFYASPGQDEVGRKYFMDLIKKFPNSNSAEAARRTLGLSRTDELPTAEGSKADSIIEGTPTIYTTPGGL